MLDSIYHMTLRLLRILISGVKKLRFCHYVHNTIIDIISQCYQNLLTSSGLSIVMHGVISLPDSMGRLDLAVPFTPFTPNRQNSNQVVLEHLCRRTPATPSSKVV